MGCADPVTAFLLTAVRDALNEIACASEMDYSMYSTRVRKLMAALGSDALSGSEIMSRLNLKSRAAFRQNYLLPAIKNGLVEMTVPDKPNSRNQMYRKKTRNESR